MQIIIENPESHEFFAGEGRWSKSILDGRRYPATALAFRAAKQESIGRFNVVGYISETRQFINLDHGRGKGLQEAATSAD